MNQPQMNEPWRNALIGFASFCLVVLFASSAFRLPEWEQAIITQFGRPIGGAITKPGLHFRVPFIQKIHRLDKRILNWDANPNQIPTKDKKYIWVDTTVRWKIVDPLLFIQTVQNEMGARSRLNGILEAATRDVISNYNLVEAVRNSNTLFDHVGVLKEQASKGEVQIGEEEVIGEIERITVGREKLSEMIIDKAREGLKEFGADIIDVQLRRIAYESSVENKVFDRMISERQRIAQKIRSIGLGEQAKIRGKIGKDLQEIESEAYRKAQTVRGDADGDAIRIYASAMNADPNFYQFVRTLEAYKKGIPGDTKLILSTDSAFFELFKKK